MKIDTKEWITLTEACSIGGFTLPTGYRLAKSLGIVEVIFGVKVIKRADIKTMQSNRKQPGNPDWIGSPEAAAEAALKAVRSRERRRKLKKTP